MSLAASFDKPIPPELAGQGLTQPSTEERVHADHFEAIYISKMAQVKHAGVKEFLSFPPNEITIVKQPRVYRTAKCSVPEEELKKEQPLHVQDCIQAFTKPLVKIEYNYKQYGGSVAVSKPAELELPEQNFTDPEDTKEIAHDIELDTALLQPYSADILKSDAQFRQQQRLPIFNLLSHKRQYQPSDTRPEGTPDITTIDTRLSITVKEITFGTDIEPFFITMTLYNLKDKVPVSEAFYVYASDPSFIPKLTGRNSASDGATVGRTATFRVSEPSPDIHLVVRVEKVLVGELEAATSYYFKSNMKPKDKQKYVTMMNESFQRLGKHTQAFAVGVIPLFKEGGVPLYGEVQRTTMLDKLARTGDISDDTLFKNLRALLSDKSSKLKIYPGTIHLQLGTDPTVRPGSLSPSLVPLLPAGDLSSAIREVQEFYNENTGLQPQFDWVHHLYVYPVFANLNNWSGKGSARNLSLDLSYKITDDNTDVPGELCLYGRAYQPTFVTNGTTAVEYHCLKPYFHEEFKFKLPSRLSNKHHIYIRVNHTNVTPKSKKDKAVEATTTVAYSCLKLLTPEGKLIPDGEHFIPAVYNFVPGYLSPEGEDSVKYVEKNRKPNIAVRTLLVSTLQTQDPILNNFFFLYDQNLDNNDLLVAINALRTISSHIAVKWFPTLFGCLMRIMSNFSQMITTAAFQAMIFVADAVSRLGGRKDLSDRNLILVSWVNYYFDLVPASKLLFGVLLTSWVITLEQKNAEVTEMTCRYSWLIFDMIIKTMTLALDGNNMLDNEQVSRSARFTGEISGYLAKLSALYLDEVVANANMARMLNENIALFLKDALRIYDRGVIMELIYLYTDNLPRSAVQLKFDFLKVIGDYEHYVPLNFPVPDNLSDVVAVESILFRAHFLSSLIVQEVVKQVEKQEWANILIGVDCLFQIALKHHQDTRYQHVLAQKCIPGMYFLLVIKLVDANDFDYRCVSEAPYEIRRKLLALFLWIVNNIQRKVLQQWWVVDTQKRVISFFMLLANCIHTFEYQNSGSTSDPEFFQTRKGSSVIHDQSIDSVKKRSGSQIRSTLTSPLLSTQHTNENELKKEQNMSREVTLIVLDLLMDFMNDHLSELRKPESVYMERVVINSLALLLRRKQCESALIALFAAVRHTVVMFPGAFFVDITPFCGEITYGILRHCNSNSKSILAKASALFYLLIRNNYRACGNFSRMKLQATIAISQLVGEGSDIIPEQFQATLAAVTAFAQKDESMKDTFKKEVAELTVRLFLVLKNSKRIEEYSYDPEMTADLFYEMSKGYVASPDLRAAWLSNLANYHETHSNFEEAAQCKIHLAALVSVYINKLKPKESVTINPLQFKRAAPNSSTEMNVPPEAFEEEGICQSTIFTRSGMFTHLQSAVTHLKTDSIFESCIAVQRLIVDVHKENRNYAAMSSVFGDLQKLSNEILTSNASNSRLFSSYYLVGFYGQPFGDLNGAQFIYKERQMVRLADISNRLKEQFAQKFGACTTLASSANLEELDPTTAHILVLSVKPYLTAEELQSEDRQSNFEKQFNIQRFIYETPMTTTGKKYSDEITEQAKKKTILETDTPFPFVIKRLRVVRSTSEILSPIQTAIELIDDRCRVTLQELEAIPPNSKTLQIILQGSVLVQVNAGPLAIAKTFLNARQSYPAEDIAKLEDSMRSFVILCDRGIKLNKSLIGPDQIEFHEHLHKGNEELRAEVAKLIPNGVPSTPRNAV